MAATVHALPPIAPDPRGAPAGGWRREWHAMVQVGRLAAASPQLTRTPRGDGSPVVLIPGFGSPEAMMGPLRFYLQRRGHGARHWGLGVNRGDPEADLARLLPRIEALALHGGRPVRLIGWSLGGVIAREAARAAPDQVAHVVTLGTPAVGGPAHTAGAHVWGEQEVARLGRLAASRDASDPIRVPITAIFSRRDGVVAWEAQIDRASRKVQHVEVTSTHVGMLVDPDVWQVVATRLAA